MMRNGTMTMALDFPNGLPKAPALDPRYRRAPDRGHTLNECETVLALKNALRAVRVNAVIRRTLCAYPIDLRGAE